MATVTTIVCFGEALWDSAPKGLFLGGAPTNVAYHLHRLGVRSLPVSAVGDDYLGNEILRRISAWGVDVSHIAKRSGLATGVVQVDLTQPSNPTYEIIDNVAWDNIVETDGLFQEAECADAIVFGSLALRHLPNRALLSRLLGLTAGLKVFDVNLRTPFYDIPLVMKLSKEADLVKLNLEELQILNPSSTGCLESRAASFAETSGVKQVCVTCGSSGAGFWDGKRWHWEDSRPIVVKGDAVGAGDAFLSSLACCLISGQTVGNSLARACRLAELVASSDGAQPIYDAASFSASVK